MSKSDTVVLQNTTKQHIILTCPVTKTRQVHKLMVVDGEATKQIVDEEYTAAGPQIVLPPRIPGDSGLDGRAIVTKDQFNSLKQDKIFMGVVEPTEIVPTFK